MPTKTTITGNIQSIAGVAATSGYVEFRLTPSSSGIAYRISGTGMLAPRVTRAVINSSGNIVASDGVSAFQVWGNANILPANTCYDIVLAPSNVVTNIIHRVLINGASYNLSSDIVFATETNVVPEQVSVYTEPIAGNILPAADSSFNLGSSSYRYAAIYARTAYIDNITAGMGNLLSSMNVYNVKDSVYGAKGDRSPNLTGHEDDGADDTDAIQAAIDDAVAAGGGIVFIPEGNFKHRGLTVHCIPNLAIVGVGKGRSNLWCCTQDATALSVIADPAADVINYGFMIKDLTIGGWHKSDHTQYSGRGLYLKYVHQAVIDNVYVTSHGQEGMYLYGCYINLLHNVLVEYNGLSGDYDGIYTDSAGAVMTNLLNFHDVSSHFNTRDGVRLASGADGMRFIGCSLEGNGFQHVGKGSGAGHGLFAAGIFGMAIIGCYFENNPSYDINLDGQGGGCTVMNNFFNGNNICDHAVRVNAFYDTRIDKNVSSKHNHTFLQITGSAINLDVGTNFVLDGTPGEAHDGYMEIIGDTNKGVSWSKVDMVGAEGGPGDSCSKITSCHRKTSPLLISSEVNTITTGASLDVNTTTGAFIPPRLTTVQRDALAAVKGMQIYNISTDTMQVYNGAWVDM